MNPKKIKTARHGITMRRLLPLLLYLPIVCFAEWMDHYSTYRNLKGLQPVDTTADGTFAHSFSVDDQDSDLQINYKGSHHPDLLNLASSLLVARVDCLDSEITVTLRDVARDDVARDDVAHDGWKTRVGHPLTAVCFGRSKNKVVYRKIEGVELCGEKCVRITTTNLELHHMFQSLQLKMSFTPSDEKHVDGHGLRHRHRHRRLLSQRPAQRQLSASMSDVTSFISGIESLTESCTLKRRRLGFMKKTFGKWKSEAKETFTDLSNDIRQEFQSNDPAGKNRLECSVGPNLEINYDSSTGSSKEETLSFSPWAKCEGCYLWAGIKVVVEIDVTATGLNMFQAYVEGGLRTRVKLVVKNPMKGNENQPFTEIIPPEKIGTVTFAVGSVPVSIDIMTGLEMMATSDMNVNTTFTAGATAQAMIRAGVEYRNNNWEKIMIHDVGYDYMLPTWSIEPSNGRVIARMQPIIELKVWETVPVVIKTQIDVGPTFSTNGGILKAGESTSPSFCSDSYRMWWSLHGIVGVDDIKSPELVVNGKTLPQITLAGGFVSDPFDLVGETEFQTCGKLCSGCYSDYVVTKDQMVAVALPGASINERGGDEGGGVLAGGPLALIIIASVIGAALLVTAAVMIVKTYQSRGSTPFRQLNLASGVGLRTTTKKTTTTTVVRK